MSAVVGAEAAFLAERCLTSSPASEPGQEEAVAGAVAAVAP